MLKSIQTYIGPFALTFSRMNMYKNMIFFLNIENILSFILKKYYFYYCIFNLLLMLM